MLVGIALAVGVPEVHDHVRGPEQSRAEHTVSVPISSHKPVPGVAEDELVVRIPLGVRVAEVHQPGRLTVQPDRLNAITIKVADERFVARVLPSNQTFYVINKLGQNDGGLGAADFSYVFG